MLCPAPGLARVFLEPQITGWLRQRLICLDRPCDGTLLKCRGILGARGLTQPPHLCRGGVAVSPCVRKSIATSHQSKSAATRKPESRMTRKWHVRFGGGRGEKAARTSLVAYPTLLHTRDEERCLLPLLPSVYPLRSPASHPGERPGSPVT